MKMLVTGGAGFIGSNLVDQLILEGNEVHVIDNFISGKKENCNDKAIYHNLDISVVEHIDTFKKIFEGVDTIFHCAALARVQPSILNPLKYEVNNTLGIMNILKAAADVKVRRLVYSASSSAYGPTNNLPSKESNPINPISPYANQKYYGELCCRMFSEVYGLETVSLRYFNVYGERQNLGGAYATVVGIFINQILEGKPLTINGDGSQRRDFTYVKDVVSANILASNSLKVGRGEVINVGSGKNISINDLADMLSKNKKYMKPVNEPFANLADIGKAKELLNWEPIVDLHNWIKDYKLKNRINI
ncbi:MAG: NAD-dependent epimerase/dehydratase family protein [Candidatus Neomarinimicrobiota bacterium]|nr:NAD-dependent epimerase/dehydratase family protein [Candidatus Neomarinimicrobiota bacterium]